MWDSVLGHEQIKEFLRQYLQREEKPHALLFVGAAGLGKRQLAQEFSKTLLCFNQKGDDSCESCRRLNFVDNNLSHPDFLLVAREADPKTKRLKDISIEQIRDVLSKTAFPPILSKYKVCLLEDIDHMGIPAANSLLKLIEEPPANWILILLAETEDKLLPTILSRVVTLRFHSLATQVVAEQLLKKLPELSPVQAEVLAKISEGSLGQALQLAEQDIWEYRQLAWSLMEAFPLAKPVNFVAERPWLEKIERAEALLLVNLLQLFCRDLLLVKVGLKDNLYDTDLLAELKNNALNWQIDALKQSIAYLQEATVALNGNVSCKMVLEALILKIDKLQKR